MKKILTLMLIAFTLALLASCGGGDGGGELNVDFNERRDILTTDMTEEELREYLTVVYTEDGEADGREVSDYTVSCAFTEGLCTAAVSYKNETKKFTAFFFNERQYEILRNFILTIPKLINIRKCLALADPKKMRLVIECDFKCDYIARPVIAKP